MIQFQKVWSYTMQIGRDDRIAQSIPFRSRFAESDPTLTIEYRVTNVSAVITAGFRVMPLLELSMNIGAGIFLGALSIQWCFFPVASICNHTSQRKGEQSFGYDAYENCIHFYILYGINSAFFVVSGLVFKMEFFSRTSPPVFCLLFLIWGHLRIALAFLFLSQISLRQVLLALGIVNEASLDPSGNGYTNRSLQHGSDGYTSRTGWIFTARIGWITQHGPDGFLQH